MDSLVEALLLAAAGVAAGAVNTVAGGGSLITFPALLAVGYPPLAANVTNAVAVLPGYVGGSIGYRRELRGQTPRIRELGLVTVVGAATGALILVGTPESAFEAVAPLMVLLACALLLAQDRLAAALTRRRGAGGSTARWRLVAIFLAAVYGGYFGAGLGILLLAVLGLVLVDDLQRLNALKGLLSLIVGAVAAAAFAILGPVSWSAAALMAVATLIGGNAGAGLARRLAPGPLRAGIVTVGVVVAVALLLS